jgi:predicted nucleic acid-binding protein
VRTVAVFDTNVLFSAVGWKGTPLHCLELARGGAVDGVTCPELLDELAEKLQSKLAFTPEQSLDTHSDLLTFLSVVPITGQLQAIAADPDDDKFLECAAAAGRRTSSRGTADTCCP